MAWMEVPGGGRIADAPVAVVFENRIFLIARADDGSVWMTSSGNRQGWGEGWTKIAPVNTLTSAPSAVAQGDVLMVFGRGPDGSVQMLTHVAGTEWPDPDAQGGGPAV